jgi:FAD-dependent urate hydroxylase
VQFRHPFGRRRQQVVAAREVVGRRPRGQPSALVDRAVAQLVDSALVDRAVAQLVDAGGAEDLDRGIGQRAAAPRAFERSRSRKASVVSRQAGTEDYNRYGAVTSRLIPAALATRYYTRWLRQISSYLDPGAPGRTRVAHTGP